MNKCKDCELFKNGCGFSRVDEKLELNGEFVACGQFKGKGNTNMFVWKDYGENSALFIGLSTNVALLRYKDFQLTDSVTGTKFKIKAENIDDAKTESVRVLKEYWKRVNDETTKIMNVINNLNH